MADDTNVGSSFSKISVDISDVGKKVAKLAGVFKLATAGVKGFTAASVAGFATTGAAAIGLGLLVGYVLVKAFQKLYGAMKKIIKVSLEYNQSLANTQSVARATASELGKLDAAARSAGETTRFTATEAADALYYLASAGFTATESIQALEGVLALAQATNTSMQVTAEELAVVISQFGFEASAASRVANVFAASITSSQSTMDKMIFSFQQAGPIAAGLGISLEETAAATNLLTNSGYRGQRAGRALRKIFGQLSFETSTMSKKLRALGLDYNKFNVTTNTLTEAFGYLHEEGVNTSQAFASFGTVAAGQAAVLVNAGKPAWEEMTAAVTDTNRAYEAAFVQNDTLQGDLYRLKSASEATAISIGNVFEPMVRRVTQSLFGFVRGLNSTVKAMTGQMSPAQRLAGQVDLLADAVVGYTLVNDELTNSYEDLTTKERGELELRKELARQTLDVVGRGIAEANSEAFESLAELDAEMETARENSRFYLVALEQLGKYLPNIGDLLDDAKKEFEDLGSRDPSPIARAIADIKANAKQYGLLSKEIAPVVALLTALGAVSAEYNTTIKGSADATNDHRLALLEIEDPLRSLARIYENQDALLANLIKDYPALAEVVVEYIGIIQAERAAAAAAKAKEDTKIIELDAEYVKSLVDKIGFTDKYTKALFKETQAEKKRKAEAKLDKGDLTGALAVREEMRQDELLLIKNALAEELRIKEEKASEDFTNASERAAVIKELGIRSGAQYNEAEEASQKAYNAIAADYRQQDVDNLSDIVEEKIKIQQGYREATEKILEDLAAFSNAYANEIISASNRLSEAQARELENAGKISEAYGIRSDVIAAGLKREQDALTANYEIEAKKLGTNIAAQTDLYDAYKKNKADLDAIYADKQSQSDIDAANAHAKYADDLLKIDADIANFSKKYTDDLVTAENTLREAEAKRLEAAGDIAGAYKIRGETIAASLKKEQDELTIKYEAELLELGENLDAKEALYIAYQESIAAIDGTYERKQRENDHNKAIADKAQFDAYVKLAFSTYESLISIAQNAFSIMYNNKQLELDKSMKAELEAAGFAEDTELEKLEKQLIAAKEAADEDEVIALNKEIGRQKIEDEYAKKSADLQYRASLATWALDAASLIGKTALAVMAEYARTGAIGAYIAGGVGVAQAAVHVAAKPQPPVMYTGGIVRGSPEGTLATLGDKNRPEAVLNPDQMANLIMAIGNGGGSTGGIQLTVIVMDKDKKVVAEETIGIVNKGQVLIDAKRGIRNLN